MLPSPPSLVPLHALTPSSPCSDSEGKSIASIDITPDGKLLVATSEEALRLYDCCDSGELKKTLYAKKYGVGHVRFMHEPSTVVCASNSEWDHSLRYWSLHENRYTCPIPMTTTRLSRAEHA